MDRENKFLRRFYLFVLLSILLHFVLGIFFYKVHGSRPSTLAPPPEQEVVWINPQDLLPPPPVSSGANLPLADIAKPKVEQAPQRPHFASQYNSTVKEETVAKKLPPKAKLNAENSEEDGVKGNNAQIPGVPEIEHPPTPTKTEEKAEAKKSEAKEENKEVSLEDLALKPADFKELTEKAAKPNEKEKIAKKELPDKEGLYSPPTHGKPGLPGAGDEFVHDFFPNIKIGDKTYLNAEAFPDVQYFTRLKRIFRMRFNPAPPLRQYLAGNRIIVGKVDVTMAMTVSGDGQLSELFVVKSSGIPGYDEEALLTVRESAPFSAPPPKVMDKDHRLRMTWSFITYL
jgi:TonB family protein